MAALSASHLKHLFWGDSSDNVDAVDVKAKNAQIGEEVYVDGVPIYQDANGAPVETVSPLRYHVGWAGILFLNVSQMVGTGVFSTRKFDLKPPSRSNGTILTPYTAGSILRALDSVGLSILYWIFGFIIAASKQTHPRYCVNVLMNRSRSRNLSGVCIFVSKSFWRTNCLPRASFSQACLLVSGHIRLLYSCVLILKQQCCGAGSLHLPRCRIPGY